MLKAAPDCWRWKMERRAFFGVWVGGISCRWLHERILLTIKSYKIHGDFDRILTTKKWWGFWPLFLVELFFDVGGMLKINPNTSQNWVVRWWAFWLHLGHIRDVARIFSCPPFRAFWKRWELGSAMHCWWCLAFFYVGEGFLEQTFTTVDQAAFLICVSASGSWRSWSLRPQIKSWYINMWHVLSQCSSWQRVCSVSGFSRCWTLLLH